ncbi:hypothetical protein F5Y09DRAFT_304475 [Xylaria sp. FL1042]|nr:hypothetical protein F5Y09DRAFT_304475 [Xylaria sp. FL1042]
MEWQETDEKGFVLSRAIGENETFIKLVGDAGLPLNREHWAINSTATIAPTGSLASSTDLAALFRQAWAHLRFWHPSLATKVSPDDDTSFIYTIPADRAALEAWVSRTFSVATDADSSADVIPTFPPTPYAKLVYIPRSSELLLHTAHWRTDGIGALLLLDALLTLASEPPADPASLPWGNEIDCLAPPVEDAAGIPEKCTEEQKQRAAALVDTFAHTVGAVGIPYLGDATTLPAGTRNAILTFSPATTDKIVAVCKARYVSVTATVHASVAGANYALADAAAKDRHYNSTIRFALRRYLPGAYATPAFAAGLYTTGWMKRVESRTSWADRVQAYQDEYRKGITWEFLNSHREYAKQLAELIRHPPQEGGEPPSEVDISSIGVAEKLIKRSYGSSSEAGLEVKAVSVGVEILTRQAVAFVWTFRDQLNVSVVYNEAFHSAGQMNRFVKEVKRELLEGLGLRDS